jgi:hypothetical protein
VAGDARRRLMIERDRESGGGDCEHSSILALSV